MRPVDSADPICVEVVRSGTVESVHFVDVAVVDDAGELVTWAGEPERVAAFRSSAKPIQARASREAGWAPASNRALAVACASHSGEPEHVAEVRALLAAAGLAEDHLRCPVDVPLNVDAALGTGVRARVFHNCSGKHAAMLAACAAAGWPLESYRSVDHPLQVCVRALAEELAGCPMRVLVDGCGVPTPVAPLSALARAFLTVSTGPEAVAMRAHPFLVGGTDRLDTDLMRAAPHLLAKSGAEGLSCVAADGLGIAVKPRDGASRACGPVLLAVLDELGLLPSEEAAGKLAAYRQPPVLGGGEPVGSLRVRGRLTTR